jgi:hypothetical protein
VKENIKEMPNRRRGRSIDEEDRSRESPRYARARSG